MYVRMLEARSRNHRCRGKAISITYFECVFVALSMRHAMRMRRTTLSSVACLAVRYFSTLYHKQHDYSGGNVIEHSVFRYSLRLLFETTHPREHSAGYCHQRTYSRSARKVPDILVTF